VLGGCSSINAMIYMRGQKEDYDHWAALGNEDWSWDAVEPVFRQLEDYEHGATDGYGAGGELRVEDPRVRWEIIDAWRAAAAECGVPPIRSFNQGDNSGCAYFQMNQKRGRRWSATNAFLRPVQHRPNLTVLTDALVERIRFEGKRATGLELSGGRFAEAKRETILATGAIGSPQILQLSGIGQGAHLQKLGIPVLHDSPGVGGNLHDHLQIRMQFKVSRAPQYSSKKSSICSRSRKAYQKGVTAPRSMPEVPSHTRCEERRCSSSRITRISCARRGIWTWSSVSTARQNAWLFVAAAT